MAQENIKEVKPLQKFSVGNRFVVVGEAIFPKKYKTEGCEFTKAQLEEIGLPEAIVDFGMVITSPKAAKGVEAAPMQFNITKPGFEEAGQKVKLQAYECVTVEPFKEIAAESTKYEEAKIIVAMVGK